MSPLFPAEQTTTTPARAALSEAIALESVLSPNSEPSDMLTTSSLSEKSPSLFGSIAHSSACVTRPLDPEQPKTRSA